ncbi:MAG: DUF1572 family protein [Terriglobales bacterium]
MAHRFTTSPLSDAIELLRYYQTLGERAMAQCPDDGLFTSLDAESNSIATIVKHLAGSMRSRWTDFLDSDGEKPDRDRDSEFEAPPATRAAVMAVWAAGWKAPFDVLAGLRDADLNRSVTIRGEPHSVTQAINRQLAHCSYHIGQIVFVARHFAASAGQWQSLTIPRGGSARFNAAVRAGEKSQR